MRPKSAFVRRYLVVMSVLTVAAVMTSLALRSGARARSDAGSEMPLKLGQITGFELTDQTGAAFGSADLTGDFYLADFIFTSCAGVCPTMTSSMAGLYREYEGDNRIHFVSITVDPETDTPGRLAEYAATFGADSGRWKFLTGDINVIESLARDQFLLGSAGEPVNHSTRFVLVDGSGAIRGFYDGTEPESVAKLRADLAEFLGLPASQR
jgi:protein SCO1/2